MKNRIKELRTSMGIKACFIAEIVGITSQSLSNIENQKQVPSVLTAYKIARFFDVPVYELFIFEE